MIITIDGPIATGKSTIAKMVAQELGFIFFDTGAMYRCVTYGIMKEKVDIHDPKALSAYLDNLNYEIKRFRGDRTYLVNGEDVTTFIRNPGVTARVSEVSALPEVREKLIHVQRDFAQGINSVFEGRDMGTTIFPNAELKIFLTGRADVRAKRRYEEWLEKFPEETKSMTLEQMEHDIMERDLLDSTREISPLRQADDAFVIDTSDLSLQEVVLKILEYGEVMRAKKLPPPMP